MKLQIVYFGKARSSGFDLECFEYTKRLKPWVSLDVIELKSIQIKSWSKLSNGDILASQEAESKILTEKLKKIGTSEFYLLDDKGISLSTKEWSTKVTHWELEAKPVAFCVGSSLGFSKEIKKRAKGLFAFGPQTMSHELAKVVLMEQLYRAWSVLKGHPYHHA